MSAYASIRKMRGRVFGGICTGAVRVESGASGAGIYRHVGARATHRQKGSATGGRGAQRDLRKGVSVAHYVSSLFPLLGFEDLELHDFTFVQRSKAFDFDRGEVDEYVFTV